MSIVRLVSVIILLNLTLFLNGQKIVEKMTAPAFSLYNQNDSLISSKQFKDKTILINFWASWCLPCRISNKKLAKKYDAFEDFNFEIISISVDEDHNKWKEALKEDNMKWPQLIDDSNIKNSVAYRWRATRIPASFLINPQGQVIAVDATELLLRDTKGFKNLLLHLDQK